MNDSDLSATPSTLDRIREWRNAYLQEMDCQVAHDSIHGRPGWTHEYLLSADGAPVGYGSVAVGGPWAGQPTVYEFYLVRGHRVRLFDLFQVLLTASRAARIEVQTNDALGSAVLHRFASAVKSESILFHDERSTALAPSGATFRQPRASAAPDIPPEDRRWRGIVEVDGAVAATGGVLFHYNRPFGDIYMDVAEPFRRRGIGSFLVQELKRVCYESGHVPAARCATGNIASQRTLQKAGFAPCGHILNGMVDA